LERGHSEVSHEKNVNTSPYTNLTKY
jgi:hypothetical protein